MHWETVALLHWLLTEMQANAPRQLSTSRAFTHSALSKLGHNQLTPCCL